MCRTLLPSNTMQVTSWNPLVVYLYDEGLARFATELYNLDHIERRCMHLTNYSLNKHNKRFVPNTDATQAPPPAPGAMCQVGCVHFCLLTLALRVGTPPGRRGLQVEPLGVSASSLARLRRGESHRGMHSLTPFVEPMAGPWAGPPLSAPFCTSARRACWSTGRGAPHGGLTPGRFGAPSMTSSSRPPSVSSTS